MATKPKKKPAKAKRPTAKAKTRRPTKAKAKRPARAKTKRAAKPKVVRCSGQGRLRTQGMDVGEKRVREVEGHRVTITRVK